MVKLNVCPFCKSSSVKLYVQTLGGDNNKYEIYYRAQVICNICYASGPTVWGTNTIDDLKAVSLWNNAGDLKELEDYNWHRN